MASARGMGVQASVLGSAAQPAGLAVDRRCLRVGGEVVEMACAIALGGGGRASPYASGE